MFADIEQQYDELKKRLNSKIWATVHYEKSAPKIEIPEFSGNYSQWISFKDLFVEAIHKNPMINSAQKMQHLKTKLRGEAERLVQHLSISADNYNSCWDILNQRYDNRRLQFTSFMNSMLNLPTIQHPDSANIKKMHDVVTECLNGISNIGIDTSSWDPIIVHIMSQKLDSKTLSDYMKELQDHRELQSLQDFLYFLETQFMAYETMKSAKKGCQTTTTDKPAHWKFNKQNPMKKFSLYNKTNNYHAGHKKCPHCNESHVLMQCDKFLEMDFGKRSDTVSKLQLCKNCLFSHGNDVCKSTKTCRECNLKHHTLLHNPDKRNSATYKRKNNTEQPAPPSQQQTSNHITSNMEVLLTTVQVRVKSIDGTYVILRALLDQGSQVNLITENAAQLLRLPRKRVNACVTGIGTASGECKGQVNFTCTSMHSDYNFTTHALIMRKLTNNLPTTTFEKVEWPHLKSLKLADPEFNISRQIDLLLGAEVYSEIILDGVLKGSDQSPVAQQTQIGWILCGKMKTFNCNYNSQISIDYKLTPALFDTSINRLVNLKYRYAPNTLQSTDLEITKIEDKIKQQKENEALPSTISTHDVHLYAISYILLASAIVAVLVVVWRKLCPRCCKKRHKTSTTGQPQQHNDIELQIMRKRNYDDQNETASPSKETGVEAHSETRRQQRLKTGTKNIAFSFD
ncbi:uncharacterized protein LOC111349653 [Spodoptera litura]|uniref:Uncharacterized protein LOC111349653 n=1 Tax=Spodoptera litura TaxID=69820 RepID=A0A9J7DSR8_SPOLT|nr:uncharacterized protein LOC111349653 [Spodoptera litura]